jgi:O-antigen/teichoic acid export membrane protein
VIHLLTHGKFDQAAELVPIWFLLVCVHSMAIPYTQYLLTARRSVLLSWSSILMGLGTMGLVIAATRLFGVIGATSAAVFGALALHGMRFLLARRLGCPYGLEPGAFWSMAAVLGMYLLTYGVGLSLAARVLLAAAVLAGVWIKAAPLWSWEAVARLWSAPK